MTREAEIQARLDNAPERPWVVKRYDLELCVESSDRMLQANLGYVGNRPEPQADLIANAPDDLEYLLAELARYKTAVAAIKNVAATKWDVDDLEDLRGYEAQVDEILTAELSVTVSE